MERLEDGRVRIADGREILEFLSGVMRGEEDGSTHNMKAAELLGRRMGLFSEGQEPPQAPVIIDDIEGPERVEARESG